MVGAVRVGVIVLVVPASLK